MSRTIPNMRLYANPTMLAASAAEEFFARALQAYTDKKIFSCALSGGSTPLPLFAQMSDPSHLAQLPAKFWNYVHFFWGDERDVLPDHRGSNYGKALEALLSRIDIPEENIHPIRPGSGPASLAAAAYEAELRQFFALHPAEMPRFDLIFLGMGSDGHTASLFPFSDALHEKTRLVVAPWVAKLDCYRITMTLPVLNNAACVIFLVQGSDKAETAARVLAGELQTDQLPAQAIQPVSGELLWLLDQPAALGLAD
jgi:6-phosphogluconolactonase